MSRLCRIAAIALVLLVSTTTTRHLYAMACEPGAGVYSPIDGQIADCLEGGGEDCMNCSATIVVK
jgi:hypothetical protein